MQAIFCSYSILLLEFVNIKAKVFLAKNIDLYYFLIFAIKISKTYFMKKFIELEKIKRKQFSRILSLLIAALLQLGMMTAAVADFINGGFEDPYAPSGTVTSDPINGWRLTGYTFNGSTATTFPTSISGISLTPGISPGGITDIYDASNPSNPSDYFLLGATPTPTLVLPGRGLQSASINFRSGHAPLAVAGNSPDKDPVLKNLGWRLNPKQATSVSQQITIQPSNIDPIDNKVHIRFIAAPVLENPAHTVNVQPFFAVQLNNLTTGRAGNKPLFFQWNYANQPSVPWKSLSTSAGTNFGSNSSYQYTDWQSFDISPGNAFIRVGDTVEIVVIASGCSFGGHEGHVYLDDVQTIVPSTLWITATGPASASPGSTVTYTYQYTNGGNAPVNNVTVVANLPQGTPPLNGSGELTPVTSAQNTTYVSNTNPTTGSCSGTAPVTCNVGTLQPGQTGTFTVTFSAPGNWVTTPDSTNTSGPVNNGNYPISGDGIAPLLGPLVQTKLLPPSALSNLVANTSGMPTSIVPGTPYTGSFTCTNASNLSATADAPAASCDITNLPPGLAVSQCTISPSGVVWTQPADIPANQTVTCDVTGTPTTSGTFTATVTTDASNNSNSTTNQADATLIVGGSNDASNRVPIPATLNGSRVLNSAIICCGRPVLLKNLPGPGKTTYKVTARTGDAKCAIRRSKSQTYLRMYGRKGSCTVVGTKNGITTLPLTVNTPPLRVRKKQ